MRRLYPAFSVANKQPTEQPPNYSASPDFCLTVCWTLHLGQQNGEWVLVVKTHYSCLVLAYLLVVPCFFTLFMIVLANPPWWRNSGESDFHPIPAYQERHKLDKREAQYHILLDLLDHFWFVLRILQCLFGVFFCNLWSLPGTLCNKLDIVSLTFLFFDKLDGVCPVDKRPPTD